MRGETKEVKALWQELARFLKDALERLKEAIKVTATIVEEAPPGVLMVDIPKIELKKPLLFGIWVYEIKVFEFAVK